MIKLIFKKLDGTKIAEAKSTDHDSMEQFEKWKETCIRQDNFGKKAGTYPASQLTDDELITAITFINTDENGNLLEDALVTIPDQYTIEVVDISAEIADKKSKDLAKAQAKKDRVAALKGIAWPSVDTVAELKAIVKLLVDETLKDE